MIKKTVTTSPIRKKANSRNSSVSISDNISTALLSRYTLTKNRHDLVSQARKGLKPTIFDDIVNITGFRKEHVAQWLDVSEKTISNYKKENRLLSPTQGEKTLKVIALFKKGESVFGNIELFHQWLEKPAFGLFNEVPLGLMGTSTGIDLIEEELIRIEYGDLA